MKQKNSNFTYGIQDFRYTIAELKDLIQKGEKNQNSLLDLVGNLMDPPWNNGQEQNSFMDLAEDSEQPEELPF